MHYDRRRLLDFPPLINRTFEAAVSPPLLLDLRVAVGQIHMRGNNLGLVASLRPDGWMRVKVVLESWSTFGVGTNPKENFPKLFYHRP